MDSLSYGDSLPIGTILPYVGNLTDIPNGWKLCDGSAGTPDLRDRFLQSYGTNTAMQFVEPGLPNIIGITQPMTTAYFTRQTLIDYDVAGKGAFSLGNSVGGSGINAPSIGAYAQTQAVFDAENGRKYWHQNKYGISPTDLIYGNSPTVQPSAYTVYYIIKIA